MTDEKLTKAAYARRREVSRMTVHRWAKSGKVPVDWDGNVLVEAADIALGIGSTTTGAELARARYELEHWRAKRAKLVYEKALANTLRADDVAEAMEQLGDILGREIDRLQTYAPAVTKIAKAGCAKALRHELKKISRQMRQAMADALAFDTKEKALRI